MTTPRSASRWRMRRQARIRERVGHYLDLVGLNGFETHYPYQLSGGMQQRVGLVRALAIDPDILLMDEPFAALDAQTREVLQEELLRIMQDERKTMVFITHSIDEAILLGDRIAVMSARPGRIKELLDLPFGRPRDVNALRADPRFAELRAHIWNELRAPQSRGRVMSVQADIAIDDAGAERAARARRCGCTQAPPRLADTRHPRRVGRGRAGAVAISSAPASTRCCSRRRARSRRPPTA